MGARKHFTIGVLLCILAGCGSGDSSTSAERDLPYESDNLESRCLTREIRSLVRPVYPDRDTGERFVYRYQWRAGSNPDLPVVVVIPGGPGSVAIGGDIGSIPEKYTVIYTDPRGSGCNAPPDGVRYALDFYSTQNLAADVLEIIKTEKLRDYSIFGISYGSVLGTVLTRKIENTAGVSRPGFLILEGILGKSQASYTDYIAGTQAEWAKLKPQIDANVLDSIINDPGYLGYSTESWTGFISRALFLGHTPGQGSPVVKALNGLQDPGSPAGMDALDYIDSFLAVLTNASALPGRVDVLTGIACQELWPDRYDLTIDSNGDLVATGPDHCALAGIAHTAPYDSADYQVETPIVYFQGDSDPATPMAGARYHFENQDLASRFFVTVPTGGHGPVEAQLSYLGCMDRVWDSLLIDNSDFIAALTACNFSLTLEVL